MKLSPNICACTEVSVSNVFLLFPHAGMMHRLTFAFSLFAVNSVRVLWVIEHVEHVAKTIRGKTQKLSRVDCTMVCRRPKKQLRGQTVTSQSLSRGDVSNMRMMQKWRSNKISYDLNSWLLQFED